MGEVRGARTGAVSLLVVLVLAGCGGGDGDGESAIGAEETAQEWVDAINAQDYDRACDLSIVDEESGCVELLQAKPFGDGLKVEGFYADRSEGADREAVFAISSENDRDAAKTGWTAYAPVGEFGIERDGDGYGVRFTVSHADEDEEFEIVQLNQNDPAAVWRNSRAVCDVRLRELARELGLSGNPTADAVVTDWALPYPAETRDAARHGCASGMDAWADRRRRNR